MRSLAVCLAGRYPRRPELWHAEKIRLQAGRSELLTAPWPIKTVSVTDPTVADVKLVSPVRCLSMARPSGTTDLLIWNDQEQAIRREVEVFGDVRAF